MASNLARPKMVSHSAEPMELLQKMEEIRSRIIKAGPTVTGTVSEKLQILEQLAEFGYGRQLILHGGINGRWSHYAFYEFPKLKAAGAQFHPLEEKMLTAKGMQSSQQRIPIAQSILAADLFDGISILSVPCGVMADTLTLDYGRTRDFRLVGIDLDAESIGLAKKLMIERSLEKHCEFYQRDAWNLEFTNEFDRVVSLGLSMYCETTEVAINLYRSFFEALKPGGQLILNYMTPPPSSPDCELDRSQMGPVELKLMPIVSEILQAKYFTNLKSTAQTVEHLKTAGFSTVNCHLTPYRFSNIAVATKD